MRHLVTACPADPNAPTRTIQFGSVVEDPDRTQSSGGATAAGAGGTPEQPAKSGARTPAPLQYRDPARYEVIGEHGRGGLGRVLRARDKELGRSVAIKEMLHPGMSSELRFFREALITARLEHPGIVPVHEAGRWPDGTPFYSMKLVAGRSLKEAIDAAETVSDRLGLLGHVIAVSDAVAYAHALGIIHRDLKPSNVIVGDFGETVVIDWGLAKEVRDTEVGDRSRFGDDTNDSATGSDSIGLTAVGSILGTPGYMAPEQSRGIADARSDVYAIGALLYHVLHGCAPGHHDNVKRTGTGECPPPAVIAIAAKAMAVAPEHRYRSARSLGDDLRRYQVGALVDAHRYSLSQLVHHWISQNRKLLAFAVAAAILLAAVIGVSATRVVNERNRAEIDRQTLIFSNVRNAVAQDPTKAALWASLYRGPHNADVQEMVAEAAARGIARHVLNTDDMILSLKAAGRDAFLSAGRDGTLRAWSFRHGKVSSSILANDMGEQGWLDFDPVHNRSVRITWEKAPILRDNDGVDVPLGSPGTTLVASFAPTGDRALLYGGAGLRVVGLPHATQPILLAKDLTLRSISWVRQGAAITAIDSSGTLRTWDSQTGSLLTSALLDDVVFADVTEQGAVIVLTTSGEVRLTTGDVIIRSQLASKCDQLAASPDSAFVAARCGSEVVVVFMDSAAEVYRQAALAPVTPPRFSNDGKFLTYGDLKGTVWLVDTSTWTPRRFMGHKGALHAAPLFAGSSLVSGDASGEIRVWPLPESGTTSRRTLAGAGHLRRVVGSPDGSMFATDSANGVLRLWSATGTLIQETQLHDDVIPMARFSHDGTAVVTAGWDGLARITAVKPGESHQLATGSKVTAAIPLRTDYFVTTASGKALIWNPSTGHEHAILQTGLILQRADAHDDSVAFGSEDGLVREYNVITGQLTTRAKFATLVQGVAYTSNGEWLVSADLAGAVEFTSRAKPLRSSRVITGAKTVAGGVAVSDQIAAIAGVDGRVRLYDLQRKQPELLRTHSAIAKRISFSPDASHLAAICEDGVLRVWNVRTNMAAAFLITTEMPQDVTFGIDGRTIVATSGYEFVIEGVGGLPWVPVAPQQLQSFIDERVITYQPPTRAFGEERMIAREKSN
jgi:WD40 repeat protein